MDDKDLEKAFDKLKSELPVNQVLKHSLRKEYTARKKTRLMKKVYLAVIAAAVTCAAFVTYLVTPGTVIERANAASLKIYNQVSFVEIGGGSSLGVSEFKGTVYLPVFGKGLFAYDKNGFHKVIKKEVGFVRTSHDGKRLAVSAGGTISIYNIETRQTTEILKGDNKNNISYEEPSWSPDDKYLIYTKKQYKARSKHGFLESDSVNRIELQNNVITKLADGSHASYTSGTDMIVFEREQKVISKNLRSGQEVTVDNGRFPMVSPDGSYVAYVKTEHRERKAAANAKIGEDIANVWIADAGDYKTKKRVTSNYPYEFTDVSQWAKALKPSPVPQVLALSGMYSYYEPVWSSDSNSLYVLKNTNAQAGSGMRLVRIDFTSEKQSQRDTVKRFLQALVVRDDDYAKSLMKNPPEILTVSNPHQVGYKIVKSDQENGREYVDAEIYSESTANPDYYITKARFYLSPAESGFIIDRMTPRENISISTDPMQTAVYLNRGDKRELLFKEIDIPDIYATKGKHRLASLAYNQVSGSLVFTVQVLQDEIEQQNSSVKIFSYNLKTKEFKLIDHVTSLNNKVNVGVGQLTLDDSGRYAAIDLFSDDNKTFTGHSFVYDLQNQQQVELWKLLKDTEYTGIHTNFWDEGSLIFNLSGNDQYMGYKYYPSEEALRSFTEK